MTEATVIPLAGGRDVEQFDPERYHLKQAALDYSIEHAKRIKDWPALEKAIDAKIDEQRKFIGWRKAHIRSDGRPWPKKNNGDRPVTVTRLSDKQITDLSGINKKQAERIAAKLVEVEEYRKYLLGAEYAAAFFEVPENLRGTTGTGQNEWFTPARYIAAARLVLGKIDLDPASHPLAQQMVLAEEFFTKQDDGLSKDWRGKVWLNPPYAQPLIAQFVHKLVEQYVAGNVPAAILLTHNYTDTTWFQEAAKLASAICFTRGRVKFCEPDGTTAAPTQGQAFTYFGDDGEKFAHVFEPFGFVLWGISMKPDQDDLFDTYPDRPGYVHGSDTRQRTTAAYTQRTVGEGLCGGLAMGAMKDKLLEDADREHARDVREWQRKSKRRGRLSFDQAEALYELEQAFEHAFAKDD